MAGAGVVYRRESSHHTWLTNRLTDRHGSAGLELWSRSCSPARLLNGQLGCRIQRHARR
jgi:hypothetical protein